MGKYKDKTICRTPTPEKHPKRIERWKYDAIRSAILKILSKNKRGVLFKDLSALVTRELSKEDLANLGSVSWYTTTVKLELEVRGEVKRLHGSKLQRLVTV